MYLVRAAIYDYLIADAIGTGWADNITAVYYERAPEEAVEPYGVHNFFGGTPNDVGPGNYNGIIVDKLWQIRFFDNPHANQNIISAAMTLVQQLFYGAIIEPAGGWRDFPMDRGNWLGDPWHETSDPESKIVNMSDWNILLTPCF